MRRWVARRGVWSVPADSRRASVYSEIFDESPLSCIRTLHLFQPKQAAQDVELDHSDDGSALIASRFDVAFLHGRDDAAAIDSLRPGTCSSLESPVQLDLQHSGQIVIGVPSKRVSVKPGKSS
jgi:hypothetical protein